jgi:hypothetical protein
MMLGRRVKPHWRQRLRTFVWPESGPRRATLYLVKRISRIDASPHAIAAGFAAGAAVSFTPFLGCHFLLAFLLAWIVRGNLVAAAFGTAVGNPLTFPLMFAATYETGRAILRFVDAATPATAAAAAHHETLLSEGVLSAAIHGLWPMIKTMSVGALPLGAVAFLVFYVVARSAASGFQRARRARRARRAAARQPRTHAVHGAGRNPVDRVPAEPSR